MDVIEYLRCERDILLNEAQRQAVLCDKRFLLLLAVPGSGKTTVLAARLMHRIQNNGVSPERMQNLTFSKETARDMKRRFVALFGMEAGKRVRFQTLHSFCLLILKRYAVLYRREMPRLLAAGESPQVGESLPDGRNPAMAALREFYRRRAGEYLTDDRMETLQSKIGYAKNRLLSAEEREELDDDIPHFSEIYDDYEAWKRENRCMDFDDMLVFAYDVLRKCPRLLREFREQYDEINLDEAQDTSPVQFRLLRLLADPAESQTGFFLVGDEDQSVYAFRGAGPEELLRFPQEYPGAEVLRIEQNYRSGPEILTAAENLIRRNQARYDKRLLPSGGVESRVEQPWIADYAEQPELVRQLLRELPGGKTAAVLYRNNVSALPVVEGLLHADSLFNTGTVFHIRERVFAWFTGGLVGDFTAYAALAGDPGDARAFGRICYKLGFSRGIAEYVREHARGQGGVFEAILAVPSVRGRLREKVERYRESFPDLLALRAADAIRFIYSELGYGEYLARGTPNALFRQDYDTALSLAAGESGLYGWLDKLEALRGELASGKHFHPEAPVVLSTLHSAKGMEFDWVILLDAADGILPAGGVLASTEEREAERRLFYVGVTRARERLILPRAKKYHGEPARPSLFLEELEAPPKDNT